MYIKPINDSKLWRNVFFKLIGNSKHQTWLSACRALSSFGDSYNIKCYQCGWSSIRSVSKPLTCLKCGDKLSLKDTYVDLYPHPYAE